jgi:hypothetical protein
VPSSILLSLLLDWNKQMATVLETPAAELPDADEQDFAPATGESVVLHGVSWKLYRKLSSSPSAIGCGPTRSQPQTEHLSQAPAAADLALPANPRFLTRPRQAGMM